MPEIPSPFMTPPSILPGADRMPLKTRPAWGLAVHENEGINQDGVTVFSFTGKVLVARRPGTEG